MVRLKGPACSLEARGKLGNVLIYQKRLSTSYARRYFHPANPRTPAQLISRNRMTQAVARWKSASDETQEAWDVRAKQYRRKGYHLYCSRFVRWMIDHGEAMPDVPFLP